MSAFSARNQRSKPARDSRTASCCDFPTAKAAASANADRASSVLARSWARYSGRPSLSRKPRWSFAIPLALSAAS